MFEVNTPGASGAQHTACVRPLDQKNPALIETMIRLFGQSQQSHHHLFPEHFGPGDNNDAIRLYIQGFMKPRNPFRKRSGFAKGLFVDEELSGYLLYWLSKANSVFYGKPRWVCYVEDIVVDQRVRGLGGGSALMSALQDELEPLGECVVSGTVWNGNAASVALFQKQGFAPRSQTFCKVMP